MKNLSKRKRLTLLISLFTVITTQVVTPIHGMGVLSGAYSAYKANKLKNDFLSAVSCTIKPWTCKTGRITLMAATFALLLYIMHAQRTKGPQVQTYEFASEEMSPGQTFGEPQGVLAAAEEKPRISVEDFKTFVLEKNPSYSAHDIVELYNNMQRRGFVGKEYLDAVTSFFQNNPGRLEEGAMEDAQAEVAAASSAAQ